MTSKNLMLVQILSFTVLLNYYRMSLLTHKTCWNVGHTRLNSMGNLCTQCNRCTMWHYYKSLISQAIKCQYLQNSMWGKTSLFGSRINWLLSLSSDHHGYWNTWDLEETENTLEVFRIKYFIALVGKCSRSSNEQQYKEEKKDGVTLKQ